MRRALLLAATTALLTTACDALSERPGATTDASTTEDVAPPPESCTGDGDCDDQKACTVDRCVAGDDGIRHCAWSIADGHCFINNVCADADAPRPGEPCQFCDPAHDARAWTTASDDTSCDDGDACTEATACSNGRCLGTTLTCEDDNACTTDVCDPALGCTYTPRDGHSCDDGVRCTVDDRCDDDGACHGVSKPCDDSDPCTVDACTEVDGCTHTGGDAIACEDGDACTSQDTCVEGACQAGGETNCDDGNSCTVDHCDAQVGCVHLPTLSPCCIGASSVCDDHNPCTDDACDALSGDCSYTSNRAACDDQDPCTIDDICADQACSGGSPRSCDDGNPCTTDSCEASLPGYCLHVSASEGACDDGAECSTGDHCANGRCVADTSECVCTPDLSSDGVKLTTVQVGDAGEPGKGLDVDLNPATCAPPGQCSGGVDNTLSVIASFANGPLGDAVTSGQVMLVLELGPLTADPVEVAVYQAKLVTPGCDFQTQTCDYNVDHAFLDPISCEPIAKIASHITGNKLVGGGPGTSLPFSIPFDADTTLDVVIANLRLEATITTANGKMTGLSGILGGAVPKQTLLDGINNLPEDAFQGVSKDAVVQLVDVLVENDIDTDGNGSKDAASIGVIVTGIDANLVGVE